MRNVFDQYEQWENRVTHALVTALAEDDRLLRRFLKRFGKGGIPKRRPLRVEEQWLPGEPQVGEDEAEKRGLPDAWIHDGDKWCFLIESKIGARPHLDQLRRHLSMAMRAEFHIAHLLLISVRPPRRAALEKLKNDQRVSCVSWSQVYTWLRTDEKGSCWARRAAEYLEIAEVKMAERDYLREGTLTIFSGFPFGPDRPYSYGEAKRVLRLALDKLQEDRKLEKQLGMNPRGKRRPAITGREAESVWDFIPFKGSADDANFTKFPHLTLGVRKDDVDVMVTVPNGIAGRFRSNLTDLGEEGFFVLARDIERNFRSVAKQFPGTTPWFRMVQRRYPTQSSLPIHDAQLECDLRTTLERQQITERGRVKPQPQWLRAAYEALASKNSNLQLQFGAVFPYDKCAAMRQPRALDAIAQTWLACKPLLDVLFGRRMVAIQVGRKRMPA